METYGLMWNGKKKAAKEAKQPLPQGSKLEFCKTEGIYHGDSRNLYIEGDNLDVLKLLRDEYSSSVKLIYIDPPYSTGKDFVYSDNFTNKTSSLNAQDRTHSAWLSMIYPRLIVAKDFLTEDGVIFISIDDKEFKNLSIVCDEVFGEQNFVANIIWERSESPVNLMNHFSANHEFVICYAKNKKKLKCNGLKRTEKSIERYKNPDNDPRGVWMRSDLSVGPAVSERVYEITTPGGRKVLPPSGRCWQIPRDRYQEYLRDNRIWFGKYGNSVPTIKRFLADVKTGMTPLTIWKSSEAGTTQEAKRRLKKLFGNVALFEYPKPVALIMRMLDLYTNDNDIVMDFFSGSGTTAEAVMRQNAKTGGQRRFICIQAPEECAKKSIARELGYANIFEIGKHRMILAAQNISKALTEESQIDLGFKMYKVT